MSDETLVARCRLGERAAFAELVRAWHPPVERYVRRMIGRADDDVVQEVWLAVFRGLPHLRQPERFAPWLSPSPGGRSPTGCTGRVAGVHNRCPGHRRSPDVAARSSRRWAGSR